MIPNKTNNNKFALYNFSGVLFNITAIFLSLAFLFFLNTLNTLNNISLVFIISFIAAGLNKITANIIPGLKYPNKNSPNDMTVILWCSYSNKTKADYFEYLRVYEKAAYGLKPEPDTDNNTGKFNQKDTDRYNPYFAGAKNDLL